MALMLLRCTGQGVAGAATGAGIIIGAFFAFYSTSKRLLREKTDLSEGEARMQEAREQERLGSGRAREAEGKC